MTKSFIIVSHYCEYLPLNSSKRSDCDNILTFIRCGMTIDSWPR